MTTAADEIDQAEKAAEEIEEQIVETEENIGELKEQLTNEDDKEAREWIKS